MSPDPPTLAIDRISNGVALWIHVTPRAKHPGVGGQHGVSLRVAVAADAGASGTAPFQHGVAIYQGSNKGLMAGVNIGLDYMRYEPMDD